MASCLSQQLTSACVPHSVVDSTIKAASLLAAGKAAVGSVSVKVAALTEGVLTTMLLTKLKAAIAVVALLGFVATVTTLLASRTAAGQGNKPPTAEKAVKTPEKQQPVGREAPRKKTEAANGLKLRLRADKTETVMKPDGSDAVPVKLKLSFTNVSDKPIKLNAYVLRWRMGFRCVGPSPESVQTMVVFDKLPANHMPAPVAGDYPVLKPGKSWSPGWTLPFPGEINEGPAKSVVYTLRKPGTYKLRVILYDKVLTAGEANTKKTLWLQSNMLELKVRDKEAAKPQPEGGAAATDAAKPVAPVLRLAGAIENGEFVALTFEVTNPNAKPLPYLGYEPGSFNPKIPEGRIVPISKTELLQGKEWKEHRTGYCGTGIGPVAIPAKGKVLFAVLVPVSEWKKARVGLVWFATADKKSPQTAWSRGIARKDVKKAK
jgi:hypothetical protein